MNNDYFQGTIVQESSGVKVTVLLPYTSELLPSAKSNIKQNVKFDNVFNGNIVVKRA
jgi:hypothetical protein